MVFGWISLIVALHLSFGCHRWVNSASHEPNHVTIQSIIKKLSHILSIMFLIKCLIFLFFSRSYNNDNEWFLLCLEEHRRRQEDEGQELKFYKEIKFHWYAFILFAVRCHRALIFIKTLTSA